MTGWKYKTVHMLYLYKWWSMHTTIAKQRENCHHDENKVSSYLLSQTQSTVRYFEFPGHGSPRTSPDEYTIHVDLPLHHFEAIRKAFAVVLQLAKTVGPSPVIFWGHSMLSLRPQNASNTLMRVPAGQDRKASFASQTVVVCKPAEIHTFLTLLTYLYQYLVADKQGIMPQQYWYHPIYENTKIQYLMWNEGSHCGDVDFLSSNSNNKNDGTLISMSKR